MELNVKLDYYAEEIEDVRKKLAEYPEVKLASIRKGKRRKE